MADLASCTIRDMRVPNAEHAVISVEKVRDYLLNAEHRRGGAKARLLHALGYSRSDPMRLADDLREQHLIRDDAMAVESPYGERFDVRGPLVTPSGREVAMRSIWQIDTGTAQPRLITMYPE